MGEGKSEVGQSPDFDLRELVLEDLKARAQRFGFDDIEAAREQDPNCAFTLAMVSVKDIAKTTGATRQEVLGTLFELTEEDMADPILDEDAPVGDRVIAFMRFADRHPEIAKPSEDVFPGIPHIIEEKEKKD